MKLLSSASATKDHSSQTLSHFAQGAWNDPARSTELGLSETARLVFAEQLQPFLLWSTAKSLHYSDV